MECLREIRGTLREYADFPIFIERIGTEVLASDIAVYSVD